MQSSAVGQARVDERRGIIKSAPRTCRQPLREATHFVLTGEAHVGAGKPGTFIDPDGVGRIDEHISDARIAQQRIEPTGTQQLAAQDLDELEYCTIAE